MENTIPPKYDLARLTDWRGLKPGLPMNEVANILTAAGLTDFEDPADPAWMPLPEWHMDLQFDEEGEQHLRQIALSDPEYGWGGAPIFHQPLHEVLAAFGAVAEPAGWRPEGAVDHVLEDLEPLAQETYRDDDLLNRGTLWLPARRLGLVMDGGFVDELVWRDARDVPRHTAGPVTEAQLARSAKPAGRDEIRFGSRANPKWDWAKYLLTSVFLLSVIGVCVFGYQAEQHWETAPHAKARLTGRGEETARPYRVFYHLEFDDAEGKPQAGMLQRGDFYIEPVAVGSTFDITYLPTEPVQVRGPASNRNGALRYAPVLTAIALVYGVLLLVVGWLSTRSQ